MTTLIPGIPEPINTGIVVGAYPADTGWSIQWQRAPDSAGSPDTANAEIIATNDASVRRLVDRLPDDGARRHYRWRHVRGDCSTPSAWSDWVSDIPALLPDPIPPIPPLDLTIVIEKNHEESDFDADNIVEGRLTLEVVERTRKWDIDFFTRQGRGTTFTTGSSFADQVDGDTMQQDVELIEKLNSYIRYEVTPAGGNVIAQAGIAVFDADEIAEVIAFSGHTDSSDNLLVSGRADTDTSKVHITITTDGTEPADPTSVNADFTVPDDAAATNARRWTNEDTTLNASGGTEVRMKARGENSAGVLAPTDTIYTFEFFVPVEGGGPVVKESTEESDFDADDVIEGRLTLTVIRASGSFDIEFYTRQGRGSFPGTPTSTATALSFGNTATQDVELVEKLNSFIKYIVLDAGTSTEVDGGVVTFDQDEIPEVLDLSVSVDKQGDVLVSGRRDSDGTTTYFTVTTDGTAPADPDPAIPNQDQATTSSSWARIDTGVNASAGQTVRVKARAGTGTEAAPGRLGPVVETSTDPEQQGTAFRATLDFASKTSTTIDVTADAVAGPSTVGPIEVQVEAGTWDGAYAVEQAWTSTLPTTVTVSRADRFGRVIKARCRDSGASNAEGQEAYYVAAWDDAFGTIVETAIDSGRFPTVLRSGGVNTYSNGSLHGGNIDPGGVVMDDGSTSTATPGGVNVSTSTPSGDYPEGTVWAQV